MTTSKFNFTVQTDKMPGGWHGSYPAAYERLLHPLKETTGVVLEIGVDGGGSMLAYRDYFPNAAIVGMDISPEPGSLKMQQRIMHRQIDAYSVEGITLAAALAEFGPISVAIDDGSHFIHHQIIFVQHYLPLLADDGIAIVEDIQDDKHINVLHEKLPPGFIGYAVDLRLADKRYDSLLFVAERV